MEDQIATERAVGRKTQRGTVDVFDVLLDFFHNCFCPENFFHLTQLYGL